MAQIVEVRGDTAANWTAANPVLFLRQEAIETDTNRRKIGDGVTAWNSLPYVTALPADVAAAQSAAAADATTKANAAQAYAIQRANHTGTQPATTVTGLAPVATSGAYADLTGRPTVPTSADYVPKWKPNTAYTAGDPVLNPSGQIATANATFTSGSSYTASNWTVVSTGGGVTTTQAAGIAAGMALVFGG